MAQVGSDEGLVLMTDLEGPVLVGTAGPISNNFQCKVFLPLLRDGRSLVFAALATQLRQHRLNLSDRARCLGCASLNFGQKERWGSRVSLEPRDYGERVLLQR